MSTHLASAERMHFSCWSMQIYFSVLAIWQMERYNLRICGCRIWYTLLWRNSVRNGVNKLSHKVTVSYRDKSSHSFCTTEQISRGFCVVLQPNVERSGTCLCGCWLYRTPTEPGGCCPLHCMCWFPPPPLPQWPHPWSSFSRYGLWPPLWAHVTQRVGVVMAIHQLISGIHCVIKKRRGYIRASKGRWEPK